MAWYKLNLPVTSDELDAKLDQYRDTVQGAIAKFGGRDMTARVYCRRLRGGNAEVFLDITGKQPPWFVMRLLRCESIEAPPAQGLELLGEVADGAATIGDSPRRS